MGLRSFINKLFDGAAEEIGEAEEKLHRPLYRIKPYTSDVDSFLVRGSWPTDAVLKNLEELDCIYSVVNLCAERNQDDAVAKAGLLPFNIPIRDNTCPTRAQVDEFLWIVKNHAPVYVHCEQGQGRTGCMVAAYRVLTNGWSPADALKEAKTYGLQLPSQQTFILSLK